jgi:cytoskeletal protein RodZ
MNDQPLDDDAELLRSLKPTQLQINWQKVLAHLPASSVSQNDALAHAIEPSTTASAETHVALADLNQSQPRIQRLLSSWWSGALAGSLITFALLRFAGTPFAATQSVPNKPQDITVAQSGQSTSTKTQQSKEDTNSSNSNEPLNRTRPERDVDSWGLIVDSGVWSSRFKRHGLSEKLVSKSTLGPTVSTQTYESVWNSSYGLPKSQAELRRELLDFN